MVAKYGSVLNVTERLLEELLLLLIEKLGRNTIVRDVSGRHSKRPSPLTLLLPLPLLESLFLKDDAVYSVVNVSDSDSLSERDEEPFQRILPPTTNGNSFLRRGYGSPMFLEKFTPN